MRRNLFVCGFLLAASVAYGQSSDDFHKYNLWLGLGPAIPVNNSTNYLSAAPMFGFGFGYRFDKYFQADAGMQIAFGAVNNVGPVQTSFGPVPGGDHEFMIPLGGRVYLPLPSDRFAFSVGGGAAYLHYSEVAPSNGYYSPACYTCTTRGGWGGYGLAEADYYLDSNHNFKVGTILQYIAGTTNGQSVGSSPATSTKDHWFNLMFDFGFSF
jgi:hypothetical protein